MAREERDTGSSGAVDGRGILKHPKPKKTRKGRSSGGSGGGSRGKKAPKPKKPKTINPGTFHEEAGAGGGAQSSTALGSTPHAAGSGMAALELADLGGGAVGDSGLGDVLLDLVGEGKIRLSHALHAWQREQERVSNRAWRRPGGMARMAGL